MKLLLLATAILCISVPRSNLSADTSKAIRYAIRAAKKTPTGEKVVKRHKDRVKNKLQDMSELVDDHKEVMAVMGVLAKIAFDGKISQKTKITQNITYTIDLDTSGELASSFKGKIEDIENSSYDFTAYTKSGDQGIRAGIKFRFD